MSAGSQEVAQQKTAGGAGALPSHKESLEKLFSRIGELSSLPTTAQRTIEITDDESSGADDLLVAIEDDVALAVRILRRVNSAYYGLRNKVADLRLAISLLGFREIRNLALTVYVARMFQEPGDYRSYSRVKLWDHMIGVAVTARLVSQVSGRAKPQEAYTAGLLHDLGLILLDQYLRREFCKVIEQVDENTPTSKIEREIFTFDHAQLGAFVSQQWTFPKQIVDAIRYHHCPENYAGEHRDLVYVVSIANYLCSRAGWVSLGVQNVTPPTDVVYSGLELYEDRLSAIWDQLMPTLEAAETLATI